MVLHKRTQKKIKRIVYMGDRIGKGRKMEGKCYSSLGLNGKNIHMGFLPSKAKGPDNLWVGGTSRAG